MRLSSLSLQSRHNCFENYSIEMTQTKKGWGEGMVDSNGGGVKEGYIFFLKRMFEALDSFFPL